MKKIWNTGRIYLVFVGLMLAQTVAAAFVNSTFFLVSLVLTLLCGAAAVVELLRIQSRLSQILTTVSRSLVLPESKALNDLRIPVLLTGVNGEIQWYNRSFANKVVGAKETIGKDIGAYLTPVALERLALGHRAEVSVGDRIFVVYGLEADLPDGPQNIYYFIDQTKLKKIATEYTMSRPVVAILAIDSFEEISKSARDSEIAAFKSAIQTEIEKWTVNTTGISRRITGDRYMLVLEDRHYTKLEQEGFSVLAKVRALKVGELTGATLSIGVGRGADTLAACEIMAVQAIEMAQGRGGDQAAVKTPNDEFKFFGGVAGAVEKRTKVRTRIVATALKKLMENSDRVLVMGHRGADLDSLGAAFAMMSAAKFMGKDAYIVMNKKTSMALPLMDKINETHTGCFVDSPDELLPLIDRRTLLIVVDVHRPSFLDEPRIYEACDTVVVIDHHRKAVDHINNAVIFYHETAASSTCEMVTELLQYINSKCVGQMQAEALLSGMMLDTKNFVLNTGTRTFEAAAFLRNKGADPVTVKKLFAGTVELYQHKAAIISSAKVYKNCAIAQTQTQNDSTRLATAQAADELLGIADVGAAFVLCRIGHEINISARSYGAMNVQVIMEMLGGGGHRTMAAAQVKSTDFAAAEALLIQAIDSYQAQ